MAPQWFPTDILKPVCIDPVSAQSPAGPRKQYPPLLAASQLPNGGPADPSRIANPMCGKSKAAIRCSPIVEGLL